MERKITDINESSDVRDVTKFTMSINSHQAKIGILVESENNEKLFKTLFNPKCRYFPTYGWERLLRILKLFNTKTNDFYIPGIIDADFRRIINDIPQIENLFMTDFHDTEMMTVCSYAWNNVVYRIGNSDEIRKIETQKNMYFSDYIIFLTRPLSILRLLNAKENLGLRFKTMTKDTANYLDYASFIDINTLVFDLEKLLKTVENKSEKPSFFKNNPVLKQQFQELLKQQFEEKELCNGHDFMHILSIALRKVIGNKVYAVADLENYFRIAYHFSDFQQTNLYQELQKWEVANKVILFQN